MVQVIGLVLVELAVWHENERVITQSSYSTVTTLRLWNGESRREVETYAIMSTNTTSSLTISSCDNIARNWPTVLMFNN